jgi:midasin (ATPase involved in ribosome maturation)
LFYANETLKSKQTKHRISMDCDDTTTTERGGSGGANDGGVNVTIPYLRRLIFYAEALAHDGTPKTSLSPDDDAPNNLDEDGESLVNHLARTLLLAADPLNLISSKTVPSEFFEDGDIGRVVVGDDDDDDEAMQENNDAENEEANETTDECIPYKFIPLRVKGGRKRDPTRIDALRHLFRALAPVSLDVATRACCHVLVLNTESAAKKNADDDDNDEKSGERERLQAFVLMGFWISVAPQLAPIISDLFNEYPNMAASDNMECPLSILPFVRNRMTGEAVSKPVDDKEAEAAVVAAEAANELLDAFCSKRNENAFVRKWWNWDTSLFILIHAGSDLDYTNVMKTDDIDADGDALMGGEDNTNKTESTVKDIAYFIGGYSPETNAPHCIHWKEPMFQMRWFASRAVGSLFSLRPLPLSNFLKSVAVYDSDVPFVRHPWSIDEENALWEKNSLLSVGRIVLPNTRRTKVGAQSPDDNVDKYTFPIPSIEDVRNAIQLHPSLFHAGRGVLIPRRGSVVSYHHWCQSDDVSQKRISNSERSFIPTNTTVRNMSLIATAMASDPHPPPILVCGPSGSGKSSLIREMARLCSSFASESSTGSSSVNFSCQDDELLELHVDEETDSKTLLGSYVATDIPGEFIWMPGPLTAAARYGRWVLIEDVDSCPEEIQAALLRLLEERVLPLGVGKEERCHPGFRLFGTCLTHINSDGRPTRRLGAGGKRILQPNLWRKVHVNPLPFAELQEVGRKMHPDLPQAVADAVLNVLRRLDNSGRDDEIENKDNEQTRKAGHTKESIFGHGARSASVREYIKLLSRIASALHFEPGSEYVTESQRLDCLAETVDIFAMSCPNIDRRRDFISQIAAPLWGLTTDAAIRYIEGRIPSISHGGHMNRRIEIGRTKLMARRSEDDMSDDTLAPGKKKNFAETNHALRLMESVAVCAAQNEPALLVGETGCGKTTIVQRLANLTGQSLLVQNLSLQTDSTDLLGGYKPLEMRHVARGVYDKFVDLFVSSFSRSQNAQFLRYVLAAFEKGDWKKLSQCFLKAAGMGEKKMNEQSKLGKEANNLELWSDFRSTAERFERQRVASESGLAFLFTEGALVDAIRTGKWVLLDEINLASSETLQRLCGLLDDAHGSITLTEKGDAEAVIRHPDFRIFAAMNPATDAGKKDLPASIRSRFTEIYVDELVDPLQLRSVAARYLDKAVSTNGVPLEHSESVMSSVDVYLKCRSLSEQSLVDGGGQRPRYTMRTLCRTLVAARNLIIQQRFAPQRALLEGFELAFEGSLDPPSRAIVQKQFNSMLSKGVSHKERDHPGRRPEGRNGSNAYVMIKPFWIKSGPADPTDWADPLSSSDGKPKFVLTPSATANLRRLCQAVASGPWSVLLEGPTSAGKTSLVEYLAARCGHRCVRINNHEHTDIQEYTGSYAADSKGKISFQEGILVQALRKGHWVILDELNLAPSEVLEALNRLLDDNRELYLAEINEVVKPHENFRLFATQNPAGAYGGRKPLSKAFRNRFVEVHMSDIPEDEMVVILERRCGCPPSHAKLLVKVMKSLRQRRSRSGIFRGKDGLITPRDLLRWANRGASSKSELAAEGYMLLAERLRVDEEKEVVRSVIEKEMKVSVELEELYYGKGSEGRRLLSEALKQESSLVASGINVKAIAPTQSMMRLLTLVQRCINQKEPVLLVGETGSGKTTVVQLLSIIMQRELTVVNCHASTETSDLLGGFRPVRGRQAIATDMVAKTTEFLLKWADPSFDIQDIAPSFMKQQQTTADIPSDSPNQIIDFFRKLSKAYPCGDEEVSEGDKKRRRFSGGKVAVSTDWAQLVTNTHREMEIMFQKHSALFEWADGPLVISMKDGNMILLDEMSLAEDAVLERLNSVLEPSRTLVLAEKGGEGPSCVHHEADDTTQIFSSEVRAHEDFRIFATMNPGGDFGKRELSPALRSRFTEIWVPSVSQRSDIDMVLERTFSSAIEKHGLGDTNNVHGITEIRRMMLDYFEWFNVAICDDPASFCNDFKLSLRDVLSWARFIADVHIKDKSVDVFSAFAHGASLMHLDGLGLGTGVSNQDATATKNKAKEFLYSQITSQGSSDVVGFQDELEGINDSLISTQHTFGVEPFTISTGREEIPQCLGFNMTAPTTGMNLRRVLRGLQISKPILLEGSPGVGKTSLISALAKASGHHLVRINLSEQTDISDLMGSDLPYSSESDSDDATSTAQFRWCDGVLLKAIKRGDWVLLDELNLASQSVLEGLNSCLDHRASVYVPELGKTFDCPPTFRIFGAQNPLAQGGGRKGLPKSFLNRFTKVYIEALTKADLTSIVATQFPSLQADVVENIISFNQGVQSDIDSRLYGQHGSPWEFNLRDIFRWCQLLTSGGNNVTSDFVARYADMLYTQRLRTDSDRTLIENRFRDHFGDTFNSSPNAKLEVTKNSVVIGETVLQRFAESTHWSGVPVQESAPDLSESLLRPMEAVASCIRMNWACLLIGPPSSGKSALLKNIAGACNVHIETLAMTSSTDVTELIGCFEQTDSLGMAKHVVATIRHIYDGVCLSDGVDGELVQKINHYYWCISKEICKLKDKDDKSSLTRNKTLLSAIEKLVECFEAVLPLNSDFSRDFADQILTCRQWSSSLKRKVSGTNNQSPFKWVDGILVQAMERGYWLHLENVNFCPSSVLDRLNPLMEFGGELVMTECGVAEDEQNAKPRVIKPHPNFRLFLSMNPNSHGEVSRAMRNRCIEVYVLPSKLGSSQSDTKTGSEVDTIDAFAGIWGMDVRSHALSQYMVQSHVTECQRSSELQEDPPHINTLKQWSNLFIGLMRRGMSRSSIEVSHNITYENEECVPFNVDGFPLMLATTGIVSGWNLQANPKISHILRWSRLLRAVQIDMDEHHKSELFSYFVSLQPTQFRSETQSGASLLIEAIARLTEMISYGDAKVALSLLDGYCTESASCVKFTILLLYSMLPSIASSQMTLNGTLDTFHETRLSGVERSELATFNSCQLSRISNIVGEVMAYNKLRHADDVSSTSAMSVIAVSYHIGTNRLDTSVISCPITPLLFPLFKLVDAYLHTCQNLDTTPSMNEVLLYENFLRSRDRFWQYLDRSPYSSSESTSPVGFPIAGFLVQYRWMKKAFTNFRLMQEKAEDSNAEQSRLLKQLLLSMEALDEVIQESTGGSLVSSDILWKRSGHPLLPSKRNQFEDLSTLQDISQSCALTTEDFFGFAKIGSSLTAVQLDLKKLIALNHGSLFAKPVFRRELLGALGLIFWAATDETKDVASKGTTNNALKVLTKSFSKSKDEFVASVHLATIDTSIKTIENALDLEAIKNIIGELADKTNNADLFLKDLLVTFGEIQCAQIGEILCISEEAAIVETISQILQKHHDFNHHDVITELRKLQGKMKSFVNKSLAHTQRPTNDLRPYQTLLWALESDSTTDSMLKHLLQCIFPRMLFSLHNHQWCNTFNDLDSISCHLLGPALWNKDGSDLPRMQESSSLFDAASKNIISASCAGPSRTELNVQRAALFRLLRLPSQDVGTVFSTVENGEARKTQAKKLINLFAQKLTVDSVVQPTEIIRYLALSVLGAFQEEFGIPNIVDLLSSNASELVAIFSKCQNKIIREHIIKLAVPLVQALQALEASEEGGLSWRRHLAHAWIHIGLLRLHLLIPSSPIDPGRKPAEKVEQLNWFLDDVTSKLSSYSLHFGMTCGDFAPDTAATKQLFTFAEHASKKKGGQQKKIIERPSNSPPFQELFREIHHFCRTVASTNNVLSLADAIENQSNSRSQEINWQYSAAAFSDRLSSVYSMYEDITIPCLIEIRSIQRGLRELALNYDVSSKAGAIVEMQDALLTYPIVNTSFSHHLTNQSYSDVVKELSHRFGIDGCAKQDVGAILRSLELATLMRLQLGSKTNRQNKLHGETLDQVNSMFASLAQSAGIENVSTSIADKDANEDQEEKELREYFPDHGAEFQRIIARLEEDEDGDESDEEEDVAKPKETTQLSDLEVSMIVELHRELFSPSKKKIEDSLRIKAFTRCYDAASRLNHLTEWMKKSQEEQTFLGSHMFALTLRCSVKISLWSPLLTNDTIRDFHSDPFPSESVKADAPLRSLLIRVGQLLGAFPGHSVLVAIGQIVEKVRQLDIHTNSLGKVMSGLEVILRKAQDWEQHASQHVQLGKPLREISSLVATWRKLELQSWSHLLTIRENRRSVRPRRHWARLYGLIHGISASEELSEATMKYGYSPSWIWKGYPEISKRLGADGDVKCIEDLAKVLDTFILTSNIAEFRTRLDLIENFANELRSDCEVNGPRRVALTRLLLSFCNYYSRFDHLISQTTTKLREPIEKRLKDEVKLAKWDEQSYYSLAESSEKNHRKLMKFLRDYDEALDTSVLSVLEQNFTEGVRSMSQGHAADHEPVTTMPSNVSIFPQLSVGGKIVVDSTLPPNKSRIDFSSNRFIIKDVSSEEWSSAGLADLADKYVVGIGRYTKRMKTVIPKGTSWAYNGAAVASDMADAIFQRIDSLREPKVTKQVKQRALTDLFKSLKDQGYSSMKWSVPFNIHHTHHMMQLPVPSLSGHSFWDNSVSTSLDRGESYFHRCQVEISRLRIEISMLGSQYMSQREMTLMQGYSHHMLFILCQQRSMLANMIQSSSTVESILRSYKGVVDSLPMGQMNMSRNIASFEESLSLLVENLNQLLLPMKEVSQLVDNDQDRGRLRDAIALITGCVSKLEENYKFCHGQAPITSQRVSSISNTMTKALEEVRLDVQSCIESCGNVIPSSLFASCVDEVNCCYTLSLSVKEIAEESIEATSKSPTVCATTTAISALVQRILISAQSICGVEGSTKDVESNKDDNESNNDSSSLFRSHAKMIEEWSNLRQDRLIDGLESLSESLIHLHNDISSNNYSRSLCIRATVSSFSLADNIQEVSKSRIQDALAFYQNHAKLLYILLRVFRNLVAKGFCSDDVSDGGEGDGEGGAGEMKFEDDVEGTGMGEGDGKNDVTHEIENEEQLLGLKGDENQDASGEQERKELKEDEVDTGMEMENDFEGEKFDLPDQPEDQNQDDNGDDEKEELDREMGDGEDPNEQVVDEKMWDNDEDGKL